MLVHNKAVPSDRNRKKRNHTVDNFFLLDKVTALRRTFIYINEFNKYGRWLLQILFIFMSHTHTHTYIEFIKQNYLKNINNDNFDYKVVLKVVFC